MAYPRFALTATRPASVAVRSRGDRERTERREGEVHPVGPGRTRTGPLHRASERLATRAAVGPGAGAPPEVFDGTRPVGDGARDVTIRNGFADADEHDEGRSCRFGAVRPTGNLKLKVAFNISPGSSRAMAHVGEPMRRRQRPQYRRAHFMTSMPSISPLNRWSGCCLKCSNGTPKVLR